MAVLFYGQQEEEIVKDNSSDKSGLATAGMVLGIIAIVGAWIPFLNIVSIVLAVLALIFGGVALVQKKSKGKAIAGVVLGVLSIVIAVYMLSTATKAIDEAVKSTGTDSSSQDSATPGKTTFGVDEAISFDQKTVTVSGVERNWNSGNEFITPDTGNEYVKVQVEIKNDSENQISYNTFDWKIKNSDGNIKDVDAMAFGVDGGLNSGELATGGKVSGFLVFQVPQGDSSLVLQYSPAFWTDRKLEITLN